MDLVRTPVPPPPAGPEVVAHRGASSELAEHTLAAYRTAVEQGADALECDVRLTADGHLVCLHDRRIDRTSDGRGVVSTRTLAELRRHDFGSWKDSPWALVDDLDGPPPVDPERSEVITLEQLLELVVDAGRPVGMAVETKHPTRYAGLVEERLVEVLSRFGLARPRFESLGEAGAVTGLLPGAEVRATLRAERAEWRAETAVWRADRRAARRAERRRARRLVAGGGRWRDDLVAPSATGPVAGTPAGGLIRMMSFSASAVRRMRALAPAVPTVLLLDRVPLHLRDGHLPFGARMAGPSIEIVRAHPRYVQRVHSAGGQVHVWTVDDLADVDLCVEHGVDAIITNRPAAVLAHLGRARPATTAAEADVRRTRPRG